MRTVTRLFASRLGLFAASLFCLPTIFIQAIFAQTNPPPPDSHEMVTHEPRTLTKPADRSAALDLLDRARQNFNLHDISTPYALKVSFETNGAAEMEGEWTMDEISDGESHWRWMTTATAQSQDSVFIRIGANGRVYGTNPSQPVPLRVQLVRSALHWPIMRNAGASAIRAADVERDGKPMSCLLLSASIPPNPAPRSWVEREYCIDRATGLLQMWSEAPGIYAVYDYDGVAPFHGHTLPRQISIFEDGRPAVQVRVESFEDAPNLDPNLFKPGPEMANAGESFTLASPNRFPMRVDPSDAPTSPFFQPVIVHAILDAQDGSVLDAEALQNSDKDLSRAAIEMVRSTSFPPSGFQQEAFINVQFHMPAATLDGPPIFHSRVRWVIWDRRGKVPPVRKPPPRHGN
ncbi:MAG TPA: hypothetical protein VK302_06435 [Terriglobales bacterium]|nr:hypothetical protein [Terriglobales bacterium]